MTGIEITGFDNEQLANLLVKVQSELASRERQRRKALRAELERRVAAEGYKMNDIFPELGTTPSGRARGKRPAKYRDPQSRNTRGAESGGHRSGCRRSSTSGGSTSPRSR